ncbi:polysaccharide deacetylase family protein [Chitinophaga sp. XS-30]|uniref:polysaccharide deacetylase family protein n=1 Tax=Chitinophaga sp. XS-30 TaxID=2604421 RepID=UPI0011DC9A31|nr:polysaccharide deacetylase family protein [Chitinophaga sp. XS-30]QEH41403.1 polysaccharide deacetylase family protein [Chitinophaga sp. XS-30]
MLKYRVIYPLLYVTVLAALLVNKFLYPLPYPVVGAVIAAALVIFIGLAIWGATRIGSNYFINVHTRAVITEKTVALSFDDGPVDDHTPQILDILQQHQVPAAFFCIGHRVKERPHLLQRIHAEGHLIGNHSYAHNFWFDIKSSRNMTEDLRKADEEIVSATGLRPRLFRPPYGVTNPNLAKAIRKGEYIPVGWSIRSLDTVIKEEEKLLGRVTRSIRPGDIFLFHDTSAATVNILPALIRHIREQGFTIRRIDHLLNVPAYA